MGGSYEWMEDIDGYMGQSGYVPAHFSYLALHLLSHVDFHLTSIPVPFYPTLIFSVPLLVVYATTEGESENNVEKWI